MKRILKIKSEKRSVKKKRRKFPVSGKGVFLLARMAHTARHRGK